MPGLSQRIRALVNEHAARAYLVVAPSLFGRGSAGQHHGYKYQMASMGEQLLKPLQPVDSSLAMIDIETVVAWAQAQIPQGRVGIIGFCWGDCLLGSRQHDPHASQSARLKTFTFFDRYLNG